MENKAKVGLMYIGKVFLCKTAGKMTHAKHYCTCLSILGQHNTNKDKSAAI